jgi:hypothetical protein
MVPVRWVMLEPPSWSAMETPETFESRLHSVSSFCTRDTSTILASPSSDEPPLAVAGSNRRGGCDGGGGDGLERWKEEKSGGVSSLGVLVMLLPAY